MKYLRRLACRFGWHRWVYDTTYTFEGSGFGPGQVKYVASKSRKSDCRWCGRHAIDIEFLPE